MVLKPDFFFGTIDLAGMLSLIDQAGFKTDGIGLIGVAGVFVWQYLKRKKKDTMLEA